jgi:hypothetical protein
MTSPGMVLPALMSAPIASVVAGATPAHAKPPSQAQASVKILSGWLPICADCKKIRDDQGYWNQVETFLSERSELNFSHGICPDCAKTVPAEIEALRQKKASDGK